MTTVIIPIHESVGKERTLDDSGDLLGHRGDDPADIWACMHDRFCTCPPGISPYDWDAPGRLLPNPPSVEGAPFTEIWLAETPEAAWAGEILRRVASSEQPIWQVLKDVRKYPMYRVEAAGVRIKDRHSDSRLVGGPTTLRKEGEEAEVPDESLIALVMLNSGLDAEGTISPEWRAIDKYFREPIVAIFLPHNSPHRTLRLDWPVVGSIPRLETLSEGPLSLIYLGERRMRVRDLRRLVDITGKPAGRRFAYFLARELAHDFFSPRRKRSVRDWATLGTVLTSLGAIAGLASQLIELLV